MKIKNIFFDYGRTVVAHPGDEAGIEIVKNTGVTSESDAKLLRDIIFSVGDFLNFLDEGSMDRDEYRKIITEKAPEHLKKYAVAAGDYHISELTPLGGMEDLLIKLKNDGYRLFITSNLSLYHAEQMGDVPITKYFDGMLFSSVIKARKPYKEFFEAALEKFGVKAEETLFIDDIEENVEGAEKCGIKGLVFKGDVKEAEDFIYSFNN